MKTLRDSGLSAAVLCGGKSSRAGFDKQTIRVDGMWIAEWIAQLLSDVFDEVLLVTNQTARYRNSSARVCGDIFPDAGPLGGIHAALWNAKHSHVFITACDMPNVSEAYLRWLSHAALTYGAEKDALVVRLANGMLESMNAIYAKSGIPKMEQALCLGERKITALLQRMDTLYVPETALEQFGGREKLFFNMNTPEEISTYQNLSNPRDTIHTKLREISTES